MARSLDWRRDHRLWIEAFALANLAGLAPDIFLAHSTNAFRHSSEYAPLIFSLLAPVVLVAALLALKFAATDGLWRWLGHSVGWASVLLGIVGLILHLNSQFFQERTLASLVYSAPFAAPLAYTGIGLLLIMNRMVPSDSLEWPLWVIFLALGGFVGNFLFSVTDHAQNAFFHRTEWIPVVCSALAVGALILPLLTPVPRAFLNFCFATLALQVAVGLLGFYLHLTANMRAHDDWFTRFVYGAPVLAPLLFADLSLLAFIGLWIYRRATADAAMVAEA